jgi:hypothetical protein
MHACRKDDNSSTSTGSSARMVWTVEHQLACGHADNAHHSFRSYPDRLAVEATRTLAR